MTLSQDFSQLDSLFFDTAPIIYYIEAHPQFGPLAKEAVGAFQSGVLTGYSSVITLAEVLAKPHEIGNETLARRFFSEEEISILLRSLSKLPKGQGG